MDTEEIMKNNKKSVLFFYQSGRVSRLNSKLHYAKEMFYGFHYFKEKNYNVYTSEFKSHKTKFGKYFFLIFEKRIRSLLKLPLYWSFVTNKSNYKKIIKSDYVILSNNRVACSVLPMIIISKFFKNKSVYLSFIMGLFANNPRFKILRVLQKFYIKILLSQINYFIFLSKGEYDFAVTNFKKYKNNFFYLPFAIDLNIWKDLNNCAQEHILFVGNDGKRDYSLAEKLSQELPIEKFVYVSEEINTDNVSNNSIVYSGSWGNPAIEDSDLRDLYNNAKITIIPLKESLQPSGQSVALQSLACGTPVLITKTSGFWDNENFKDSENIFFIDNNDINNWKEKILSISNLDKQQLAQIIENGKNTISLNYDLIDFNKNIETIIHGNK